MLIKNPSNSVLFIKQRAARGRFAHHIAQALAVALAQQNLELAQLILEERHLLKERVLIQQKEFTPHLVVHPRDPRQITEGVTRIVF